jgi:hypothetical protein
VVGNLLVFSFRPFGGMFRFAIDHDPSEPVAACCALPVERLNKSVLGRLTHRERQIIIIAAGACAGEVAGH